MKTILKLTLATALLTLPSWADSTPSPTPASSPASSPAAEQYTCPMHPEVIDIKPSTCPKCGMKLIKKK